MPDGALEGVSLYMRSLDGNGNETFTLYAAAQVKFASDHRRRLEQLGVTFVYIMAEDQPKLRRQLQERIETLADDKGIELGVRCEIIYESTIELIDEALATREVGATAERLKHAANSIVRLYEESEDAFKHFYGAARHDAGAATHAANVAAWMPALAKALGETAPARLRMLCLGGMLYDVGMAYIPATLVKHDRKLSAVERQLLRSHTEIGIQILRQMRGLEPTILMMALQHHERLDGSGYPRKLTFDRINPAARMAAVLDTFEAVTSFRPFRKQGKSPAEAIETLRRETPDHYDPRVLEAWIRVLQGAFPEILAAGGADGGQGRRRFERYSTNCPAELRLLTLKSGIWTEEGAMKAIAHNLSRGGLGLLLRKALQAGQYLRVKLAMKNGMVRVLTGVVVRVQEREDGIFDAGVRFVDLEQELASLPAGDFAPPMVAGDFVEPEAVVPEPEPRKERVKAKELREEGTIEI
jgi:HD-GYP domain-containing protein (c-di-GMP phosphodiesterase class II)